MAITAETRNSIIELVVTAYDAAPGTTLLTELITIINEGGTLADVATELTTSDQWNATYPIFQTAEEFAAEWLGKLLAEADADTLALAEDIVVGLINDGASAADLIMVASDFLAELDVEDELLGSSAAGFANKVEVATYFTVTLEQDGTQDELAAAIAGVSSDEDSVDEAKEDADSVGTPGTTFTLTKDVDDITGSAGDDTITAEPGTNATTGASTNTINSGDAIDGAGGDDTLNITVTATNNNSLSGLSVSNVEVVNITGANYLGGSSGAAAAAEDALATAESDLATAILVDDATAAEVDAATALDDLIVDVEASAATDASAEDVLGYLGLSSTSSIASAKAALDYLEANGYTDYAEIEGVLASTFTLPTGVTSFTLAEMQAAATATLTNANGSSNINNDAGIDTRLDDLIIEVNLANNYAQASGSTEAALTAQATAFNELEVTVEAADGANSGAGIDVMTLAAATTSALQAAQIEDAYEAVLAIAEGADADAVAAVEAIANLTTSPSDSFTIDQYKAAAAAVEKVQTTGAAITEVTAVTAADEEQTVTFTALAIGQAVTIGGLRIHATAASKTAAEVAALFANVADGDVTGGADVQVTYSGTFEGFTAAAAAVGDTLVFTSDTAETDVADISIVAEGATAPTVATTQEAAVGVTGVAVPAAIDARATLLDGAATEVAAEIGDNLLAGTFSVADVEAAVAASGVDATSGEALTSATDIEAAAEALGTAYTAYAAAVESAGVDSWTFAELQAAATAAALSSTGASLITSSNDIDALEARAEALVTATNAALTTAETALATAEGADITASTADSVAVIDPGSVAASQFSGASEIWLKGASNTVDVTGATTQTIGLSGLSGMDNSIAFGSASGTVYIGGSSGDLTVTGAKALSLAGTTGTVTLTAASSTSLAIDMSGANTLTLTEADALESITVTGEGSSTLKGVVADVETITSTDGAVSATISTDTLVDDEATTKDETVSATVSTAGGADVITVSSGGTGTTTVSTGEGDDTVVLTRALNSRDSIDGGDGADTMVFIGSAWTAQDYVVLDAAVSGFEVGAFYAAPVTADVSKLGFPVIAAQEGGTFTEASGAAITTWATSSVASTDFDDSDPDEDVVYGGDLTVTMTGGTKVGATTGSAGGGTLTLEGSNADVTVAATTTAGISTTINGNLETLTVATANSAKTTDHLVTVEIEVTATENEALTSVILTGNGTVTIDASGAGADALLTSIDASGLGGTLTKATSALITGGLVLDTNVEIAETVTLGSGKDTITANSTYENMDTIVGADFEKETSTGTSVTDIIVFNGVTIDGLAEDDVTEVELTSGATTLGLAFVEAAAAAGSTTVFFHFGGDTYVYNDGGDDNVDDSDPALKIVGIVDLSADFGVFAS